MVQEPTAEERTFKYCRPAVMYDHFDRKHAQPLKGAISYNHPQCRGEALEFKHLNHFKNHVERVHGVRLRASMWYQIFAIFEGSVDPRLARQDARCGIA
ncbi:hypothetical protein VTK56DRAFT_6310 [Thermocarpiscus australiensis]